MRNQAEYSWLSLLLVTAIGGFLYHSQTESIQHLRQPSAAGTHGVQRTVMRTSLRDRLPQASPALAAKSISPSNPANAATTVGEEARGLNRLGVSYLNGTGVKRDLPAAFAFLSLAAEQGDASAMNSLAGMYEKGLGTDADRKKAIELYAKASQAGNQPARDNLQRLGVTRSEAATMIPSRSMSAANAIRAPANGTAEISSPGKSKGIEVARGKCCRAEDYPSPKHPLRTLLSARVGSRLSSLSFPPSQPSRKADL
jgi:hypothetical protein